MTTVASAPPAAREMQAVEPYKGLAPYLESDSNLFFGRDREIEIICANLMAARLTLLYGESGVGKSSVLLAGAVHRLREEVRHNLEGFDRAEFAVVVCRSWRDDPVRSLIAEVREGIADSCGADAAVGIPDQGALVDVLRAATECIDGHVLVILDQFDEYFQYHGTEDGPGTFAVEFPEAVNESGLRASFLVSMREDAVAKLDRFKGRIPSLFENRLRIDHLGMEAAREAIERPLDAFNKQLPPGAAIQIEPKLVNDILGEITGSTVALGQVGAGDVAGASHGPAGDRVQAPYLQVVLRRLWLEEVKEGSRVLRAETLERLGGCENIVRTRLGELMDALTLAERNAAAALFRFLVTRSGAKVAHSAADLADFTGLPVHNVAAVLDHLAAPDVRLLRPVEGASDDDATRYEIAHDVVGPAILNWRALYEQEAQVRKERRRTRIAVGIAGVSLLGCLVLVFLGLMAAWAWRNAESARDDAVSAREEADAAYEIADTQGDPATGAAQRAELALRMLEAGRQTELAEDLLREAVPALRVRRIIGGVGDPRAAAITASGDRPLVALATEDRGVRIVDADTGEDVSLLRGVQDPVLSSSFDADGSRIVTVSADGTASLWDPATGSEIAALSGAGGVSLVTLDPSGKYVAGAGSKGRVHLWSGESGASLHRVRVSRGEVVGLSFSGDGSRLATVSTELRGSVRLWAVSDSRLREEGALPTTYKSQPEFPGLPGRRVRVQFAELNRWGTRVVTADTDGRVQLWDARTRVRERTLSGAGGTTRDIAFSPGGDLVAAAQQKLVRVWTTSTGEQLSEMHGHQDLVNLVEFRADGENVLSASADGTARVWEARTGLPLLDLRGHTGSVETAGYLPGGSEVVTVSEDATARVWDVETGAELRGHRDRVVDATFSPGRSLVATVGVDGQLITWNATTHERVNVIDYGFLGPARSIEFSPDGESILTAWDIFGSGGAILWDATELSDRGFFLHGKSVTSASFSPDGKQILTTSEDGTARVWDREKLEEEGFLDEELFRLRRGVSGLTHDGPAYDAAYSSGDGDRIVTVGADEVARVWSSLDGRQLGEFEGHDAQVLSVSFSRADPDLVVTGSRDYTAQIWNVETREEVATLVHPETVTTAAFSPDGVRVVTGSPGGVTRIWDWRREALLATMRMHGDYINSAEFGPDGLVLTSSDDWTAKLYPCDTCKGLEELKTLAKARLDELAQR
ncbi:MAG TPA: AAA family ATPase [Gaiellaceae bacterium]|nr:AAA family ATPase [Gaiellaceae bacterium]